MLVTFVIGADEWQCHKNPIVTIIIGTNRFKKVVHCSEIGGSRLGSLLEKRVFHPFLTHFWSQTAHFQGILGFSMGQNASPRAQIGLQTLV